MADLNKKVVLSSSGADLDLFEAGSFLGQAFFFLFFFPLIAVFVIGNKLGYGWSGIGDRFY